MSRARRDLGMKGEDIATNYLRKKDYTVLEQNFRNRFGEIDIIAKENDILVFVEVKTRHSDWHGSPADAVTHRKQQQISKVALSYLSHHDLFDHDARFDVVSIVIKNNRPPDIEHIRNAFDLIA
jgi:putative endonuclease